MAPRGSRKVVAVVGDKKLPERESRLVTLVTSFSCQHLFLVAKLKAEAHLRIHKLSNLCYPTFLSAWRIRALRSIENSWVGQCCCPWDGPETGNCRWLESEVGVKDERSQASVIWGELKYKDYTTGASKIAYNGAEKASHHHSVLNQELFTPESLYTRRFYAAKVCNPLQQKVLTSRKGSHCPTSV